MKLSELKKQIKDNIYELLSEDTKPTSDVIKKTYNEMFGKNPSTTFNDVAKKLGTDEQTIAAVLFGFPVFESDDEDQEPSKAELEKKDSITTASNKLQKLVTKMKELAKEYTEAKGDKKEKIKDELKKLTADKKALEKIILPSSEED
jgi:uncharacterized protein (UPF0335 family)